MKKKLVFATNNAHKLDEISSILGEKVELLNAKILRMNQSKIIPDRII
jgi:inosine/xanthosine triphosphate pyrophosphatase family protein